MYREDVELAWRIAEVEKLNAKLNIERLNKTISDNKEVA